jgi:hypothetical protein
MHQPDRQCHILYVVVFKETSTKVRLIPGNPERHRGPIGPRCSAVSFSRLLGGAPVSLTCPPNEGRRLLASLERCGRRGIRFTASVGFLPTLLRRVLLLLSFFGFPRLVAHGAPPVVRVSNERIGCVQQYHLRHASGQRGSFSRSEPSRSRAVSVRSRSRPSFAYCRTISSHA